MNVRVRYSITLAAAALWIASFFLPAVRTGQGWQMGYQIAAIGWAGPLAGQFGSYANLVVIPALGVLALGDPREDFGEISKLGLVLFLLWVNTLFWSELRYDARHWEILARGPGFYSWMVALLAAWLGLFILGRRRQNGSGRDLDVARNSPRDE
jgi:hypothetical protein